MSDDTTDSDQAKRLVPTTRRKFLAAMGGTAAGAAALGSGQSGGPSEKLAAGGYPSDLTTWQKRTAYATGPSGSFDASVLTENELYWETDTGEIGVKTDSGTEQPPIKTPWLRAGDTTTETLEYDYSDRNPQWPRQPEQGGPIYVRPYPGVDNPLLTESDVGVATNGGVADPLIRWMPELGQYVIFAEIYPDGETQDIAYWTSPTPTVQSTWTWGDRLSLSSVATAFPYTVKHQGQWYMFPGMPPGEGMHVYQLDAGEPSTAADLANWTLVSAPLAAENVKDPVVFEFNDLWWVICNDTSLGETNVFYADAFVDILNDNLTAHPSNPVMPGRSNGDGRVPGGTPIVREHYVDFIDHIVNIHRITELTKTSFSYTEKVSESIAVLTGNGDWNDSNMHTLDVCMDGPASLPLVVVDGAASDDTITTGLYTVTSREPTSATIYAGASQTATSGAWTTIALDTIDHDLRNVVSTANGEYRTPTKGYYQISGAIKFSNVSATDFSALLEVVAGGVGGLANNEAHAVVDGEDLTVILPTQTVGPLSSGTALFMRVFNRSANGETISSGLKNTFLSVRKVPE